MGQCACTDAGVVGLLDEHEFVVDVPSQVALIHNMQRSAQPQQLADVEKQQQNQAAAEGDGAPAKATALEAAQAAPELAPPAPAASAGEAASATLAAPADDALLGGPTSTATATVLAAGAESTVVAPSAAGLVKAAPSACAMTLEGTAADSAAAGGPGDSDLVRAPAPSVSLLSGATYEGEAKLAPLAAPIPEATAASVITTSMASAAGAALAEDVAKCLVIGVPDSVTMSLGDQGPTTPSHFKPSVGSWQFVNSGAKWLARLQELHEELETEVLEDDDEPDTEIGESASSGESSDCTGSDGDVEDEWASALTLEVEMLVADLEAPADLEAAPADLEAAPRPAPLALDWSLARLQEAQSERRPREEERFAERQRERDAQFETPDAAARFPYAPGGETSVSFGEAAPPCDAGAVRGPVGGPATVVLGSGASDGLSEAHAQQRSADAEAPSALPRFPQAPGGDASVCLGGAPPESVGARGPMGGAATIVLGADDPKAAFRAEASPPVATPDAAPRFPQVGGSTTVDFGGAGDAEAFREWGPVGGQDTVSLGSDAPGAMFAHRLPAAAAETPDAAARFPQAPGGDASVCLGGAVDAPAAVRGPVGGADTLSLAFDPAAAPAEGAPAARGPVGGAATVVLGQDAAAEAFAHRAAGGAVETPDATARFPQAPGGDASVVLGGAGPVESGAPRGPVGGAVSVVLGADDAAEDDETRPLIRQVTDVGFKVGFKIWWTSWTTAASSCSSWFEAS